MTTLLRVMTVFQGISNLPEDRYVTNTQWSGPGTVFSDDAEQAFTLLREFWSVNPPPDQPAVGAYISASALRNFTFRAYNLLLPENEREPYTGNGTLPPILNAAAAMPSEVSIVLTFVGGSAPYSPADRNRFYIGPITQFVQSGTPPRVSQGAVDSIKAAAERMRQNATNLDWVVVSRRFNKQERAQPLVQPVVGGWVDNAFDIQRRRGEAATERDGWGALQ